MILDVLDENGKWHNWWRNFRADERVINGYPQDYPFRTKSELNILMKQWGGEMISSTEIHFAKDAHATAFLIRWS